MKRIKRTAVIRCAGISLRHRIAEDETGGSDCLSLKSCYPPGTAVCMFGCLGGGSCLEVCPRHAIVFRDNGCAMVDREKCIGCGKCVKVCPQQLIELVPAENNIQPQCSSQAPAKTVKEVCISGCIGCGICEKVCPSGAVHVLDGYARIDQTRCIACGICAARCPRGVIHDANGIISVQ